MCAARWLEREICCNERFIAFGSLVPESISRCASSAWVRSPASGVLSWCAASARNCFCARIDWSRRASKSLMARTSGDTSSGASRSSMGLRSLLSRPRIRRCNSFSGAMPRASASHTSSTASGKITNCGRITPLMISLTRRERLPKVSATCSSGAAAPTRPGKSSHR